MDPSERFFRSLYEKQYEKMFKLAYRMTGSIEKTCLLYTSDAADEL